MTFKEETVYLWNQFCALEINYMSNGWFKFALDGKPQLMYSSGIIQPDKRAPSKLSIDVTVSLFSRNSPILDNNNGVTFTTLMNFLTNF